MVTWQPSLIAPLSSALAVSQTLGWLNLRSPAMLINSLFRSGGRGRGCRGSAARELIDQNPSLSHPAKTSIHQMLIDGAVLHRWGSLAKLICSLSELRACPECLAVGYHSVVHQVTGPTQCPIHAVPISRQCWHCGAALPPYFFNGPRRAFACLHCRRSCLREVNPELVQAIHANLMPLDRWLSAVAALGYDWVGLVKGPFTSEWKQQGPLLAPATLLWCLHLLRPYPAADSAFGLRPQGLALRTITPPLADSKPHCRQLVALAKCLRRHVRRHRLRGHRQCVRQASLLAPHSRARSIGFSKDTCPYAQAYHAWLRHAPYGYPRPDDGDVCQISDHHAYAQAWGHAYLSTFISLLDAASHGALQTGAGAWYMEAHCDDLIYPSLGILRALPCARPHSDVQFVLSGTSVETAPVLCDRGSSFEREIEHLRECIAGLRKSRRGRQVRSTIT